MLLSSLPPEDRNWEARGRAGWEAGSDLRSDLSGAQGSSPSPSVPRQATAATVPMVLAPSGQDPSRHTSRMTADSSERAEATQWLAAPSRSSGTSDSATPSAACSTSSGMPAE